MGGEQHAENRRKVRLIDGRLYDPWNPSGLPPSPETAVYGLSRLCRYGGAVRRFYSVAEHCIWVMLHLACGGSDSREFQSRADVLGDGGVFLDVLGGTNSQRARLALLGLVHDAPEGCGLVDMPGPVLRNAPMAEYRAAHVRCADWLLDGWGIVRPSDEEAEAVRKIDYGILGAEMLIRPAITDGVAGSGEDVPPWPGLDLFGRHNLARFGSRFVREAWLSAYHTFSGVNR